MDSRRFEDMGRGWADTAHATELQPVFCSVGRIGASGDRRDVRRAQAACDSKPRLFCTAEFRSAQRGMEVSAVKSSRPCYRTVEESFRGPVFFASLALFRG